MAQTFNVFLLDPETELVVLRLVTLQELVKVLLRK